MDKASVNLHILTPHSQEIPIGQANLGDRIIDLRRFPPLAYEVDEDGTHYDITDRLLQGRDYWTIAREWLADFTAKTGLQDVMSIEGYGLWWTHVSQQFVAGLSELGNIFAWIDLLHAICAESYPSRVLVHGQHKASLHLVHEVCHGVEVKAPVKSSPEPRHRAHAPRHLGLLLVRLLLSLIYLAYSLIRRPQIVLLSNTNLLRKTRIGPQQRLRDAYLGEVEAALRARGWRVVVAEAYGWNASWTGLAARGLFFPSDLIVLVRSLAWARIGFHRRAMHKWQERWSELQPQLAPHLRYRGYNLAPLVESLVARELTYHAPQLEVMVRVWQRLLRWWQPKLLYVNNAYGEAQMTAIIAAKSLGIATVEQQHGLIGRNHLAYLVPRHIDSKTLFPLCDRMLVWGEYTWRFLVRAGVYQPEQVTVVGFPRADMLLRTLPSRAETRAELGIPAEAKVVLYTSNGFATGQRDAILDSIRRASSREIYWLIKLHPREKTRHLWEAAIQERKLRTTQVLEGEFDFYSLLSACDFHISFASTTLIEAAILGKPNLGLDVPHVADPGGYAEAKAFLPVPPDKVGSMVQDLLANPAQQAHLLTVQKAFARDWCVHDGKSVERVVSVLESVVAEERKP